MQFPKEVILDEADAARVRDINDKTIGVQRAMQMFQETSERRVAALQAEGRSMFQDFAKKYNLDIDRVAYQPSADSTKLIPMQIMLGSRGDATDK